MEIPVSVREIVVYGVVIIFLLSLTYQIFLPDKEIAKKHS